MKKRILMVCCLLVSGNGFCSTLKMKEGVIKADISYKHLNRISVKGDRIASVTGLENAFQFEKNEKTGEGYIRATVENGYEPIGVSVTTVSGKTQDLLLNVVDGDPTNIQLEADHMDCPPGGELAAPARSDVPSIDSNQLDYPQAVAYEDTISETMRLFVRGENLEDVRVSGVDDRKFGHIRAKFVSAHRVNGILAIKFRLSTDKEGCFKLSERDFSQKGDLALTLSELSISKCKSVVLYVLRH